MNLSADPSVTDWTLITAMAWLQLRGRERAAADCLGALGKVEEVKLFTQQDTAYKLPGLFKAPDLGPKPVTLPSVLVARVTRPDIPIPAVVVSVTGTATVYQWCRHFLSTAPTPSSVVPGVTHGYFREAALAYWPLVREFAGPPVNLGPQLFFVGHSLGGGVAQLLLALALKDGYARSRCLTAGSPAVGNDDFAQAVAPETWRLVAAGDPVPSVPPTVAAGLTSWFGLPVALGPYAYSQTATASTLGPDGTIAPGWTPMPGVEVVRLLATSRGAEHVPQTYLKRLGPAFLAPANQAPGAEGYADPYVLTKALAEALPPVAAGTVPPPVPDRVRQDFPADPPGSRGPVPRHPPLPLPPSSQGVFMGAPATPLPALAYRFLFRFNMGAWGWTEEYIFSYATPSFALATADAANLARMRRAVLNSDASIFGYRVQEWGIDPPRGSQFISDSALGCGPGEVDDVLAVSLSTEPVWDTALVSLWDDTRQYRRPLFIRGVPSQYVVWKVSGDAGLTAEGEAPMKDFLAKLLTRDPNAGLKGTLVLYGRSRDLADTGEQRVQGATVNARCGTDIVTNQEPAWAPGDTVHVHQAGCDQCHVPGMAGDTCVLDTNLNQDSTFTTTIARRPCCCGSPIDLPTDTVIGKVVKRFYALTTGSIGRLTSRATGAGFGAGRGRARSCRG